jgi:hypothetical protein
MYTTVLATIDVVDDNAARFLFKIARLFLKKVRVLTRAEMDVQLKCFILVLFFMNNMHVYS